MPELKAVPREEPGMRSFRIGSLFGIPIKLDLTFLLILPVYAYLIGSQVGPTAEVLNQAWALGIDPAALSGGGLEWVVGLLAALGDRKSVV